jgi:site-specific DNA-methyltransferase (adenine-specific)
MRSIDTDNIYLMDGIEGLRSLPSGSVDMLLTDPPYGTTKNYWDEPLPLPEFWAAVKHAVKPNGAVLMFAQCPYDKILGASNLAMLRYEWIWCKDRITGFFNARRMPLKKSENILVFYQKLPTYNPQYSYGKPYPHRNKQHKSENYGKWIITSGGSPDGKRFPCNVISFNTVQGGEHPTQKPVELCEYLIKTYTDEGELVVDICAGSGTTAAACIRTGRRFICFENAPQYFSIASERIRREQTSGQLVPKSERV